MELILFISFDRVWVSCWNEYQGWRGEDGRPPPTLFNDVRVVVAVYIKYEIICPPNLTIRNPVVFQRLYPPHHHPIDHYVPDLVKYDRQFAIIRLFWVVNTAVEMQFCLAHSLLPKAGDSEDDKMARRVVYQISLLIVRVDISLRCVSILITFPLGITTLVRC